jgi:kynurenine 3-monooxygenase
MSKKEKIIIVGAGLCGSLLALRMAQRGHQVVVYEKRGDMRLEEVDAGRSINLALSARGLMALDRVGLKKTIAQSCIPMNGRMIHPLNGDSFLSPYSGRSEDYINSVSRSDLNILLLNEADYNQDVTLCFDSPVKEVDLKNASVKFVDPKTKELKTDQGDIIIGTDGAGSVVRRSLMSRTTELLFNYEQNFLRHGYKELSILPKSDGGWRIEKNALHIWPRGHFMIIALPNLDGSFTVTMFHPYGSDIGFNALDSDEKVKNFFEKYFPTLIEYMPDYVNEYNQNPVGTLGTIKCYPWQAYGKTLIMGDASHAIVPFYGQGMNASFEDVRVFDDMMNLYGEDWPTIFEKFQDTRVNNANAIADLAIDNFYEMRDKVDDKNFKLKRQLEMQLEQQYPEYYSKYSLVTFKPDLGYHDAMVQGRNQDSMLLDICDKVDSVSDVNLSDVFNQLKSINT